MIASESDDRFNKLSMSTFSPVSSVNCEADTRPPWAGACVAAASVVGASPDNWLKLTADSQSASPSVLLDADTEVGWGALVASSDGAIWRIQSGTSSLACGAFCGPAGIALIQSNEPRASSGSADSWSDGASS